MRYGTPLSGHSEMTLALLPAYWFKQAAPTNPGETDQPGTQRTNAPVSLLLLLQWGVERELFA